MLASNRKIGESFLVVFSPDIGPAKHTDLTEQVHNDRTSGVGRPQTYTLVHPHTRMLTGPARSVTLENAAARSLVIYIGMTLRLER